MNRQVSIERETKVVAMLARGDEQQQIIDALGGGITKNTITAIKKRNKENLALIQEKMSVKAAEDAMSIKNKANVLISKKLDMGIDYDKILDKARQEWVDGDIDNQEFQKILNAHHDLSIGELVNVSREMHSQAAGPEKPPATASDLALLAAAIKSGDTLKITQMVFENDKHNTAAAQPVQPIQPSE